MTGHSPRASPALQALVETDPAIAALALWCEHRDGGDTRTQGDIITYGPDFPALAPHEQTGLASHHVLHVALRHSARHQMLHSRLGDRFDADLFGLCADALVNEALLLADHALPRPAVTLTGLLAETLGDTVTPHTALADWDVERLYFALTRPGEATRRSARRYAMARRFTPDLDPDGKDAGTEEAAGDRARWQQHLSRALDAGRRAGRGLGLIGHRIADIPETHTPWELHLRALLARAVTVWPRPSPHRPSRRWIAGTAEAARAGTPTPGYEPGQRLLTDLPRIAVALDASGSIDDARLALFWGEITGIARRLRAELHLMVFDDALRQQMRIDPGRTRLPTPDLPRGGGTAFAPVIEAAQTLNAAALVILTDLDGDPGPAPRALRVIWALPDAGNRRAPFGTLLNLAA